MSFVQTHSGRAVDLLLPDSGAIFLPDIAVALSRLARFTGATSGHSAYSVAQHSCWCEEALPAGTPPNIRLSVLLHDAHEAYTGDITSPVKDSLPVGLKHGLQMMQSRLDVVIREAVGLPWDFETPGPTMLMDRRALAVERRDLMAGGVRDWGITLPDIPRGTPTLEPLPAWAAAHVFTFRVRLLVKVSGLMPLGSFGMHES